MPVLRKQLVFRQVAVLIWVCLALMAGITTPARAEWTSIALVLSDDAPPYQEFAARFQAVLVAGNRSLHVSHLNTSNLAAKNLADASLIVPVGVRATEAVLRLQGDTPVLAALVPRTSFFQLKKLPAANGRAFSAIYLDQPLSRRFNLIGEALPNRKRVGVLLGSDSAAELRSLQTAARENGMNLVAERISDEDALLPALKRILMDSDVLLAMPDPLVFSRNTVQSILLTSYRAQDPVVAYSAAYVSAGALLAVYSTPAQIGQQSAETVLKLAKDGGEGTPAPQYPIYFSVSVNRQVARSMGIEIADEQTLFEGLMAAEGRK